MITFNRHTKIAAIAAVGLSLTAPAVASAADHKAQNALIGGLLGAVAGGLIGGDGTGAIVGAGAGALLGASTTQDRYDGRARYRSRYVQPNAAYGSRVYGYGSPAYGYGQSPYAYGRPQELRTAYGAPYGGYRR